METEKTKRGTWQFTVDAMLAAMCVVLGFTSVRIGNIIKISLEDLPVLFAALMFGPVDGALVGFTGILLYQLLSFGLTPTTPLWILPFVAAGALAGMIAKRYRYNNTPKQIMMIFLLAGILILALNSVAIYVDSKLYGYYYPSIITGVIGLRLLIALAKAAVLGVIVPPVLRALSKYTGNGRPR